MAYCPNCGAPVDGRYCSKCGTAMDAPVPAPSSSPTATTAGLSENAAAALCYVLGFITGILFLVLEPYNRNKLIRFHAFQSIFLNVAALVLMWAIGLAFGWFAWRVMSLIQLAFLVLWVYLIVATYQGKKIVLPVIGNLAAKQA